MKTHIPFLLFLLTLYGGSLIGQETKLPSEFKGTIIDVGGIIPGSSMPSVNMKIDKYTSDEDIKHFATLLADKGPIALAEAIHDLKNGSFTIESSFPYHLSITRTFEKNGKRYVRGLTDRPMMRLGPLKDLDTKQYPFGFIEVVLDENGKGTGTIIAAATIQIKNGSLEMERSRLEPLRITKVTAK